MEREETSEGVFSLFSLFILRLGNAGFKIDREVYVRSV